MGRGSRAMPRFDGQQGEHWRGCQSWDWSLGTYRFAEELVVAFADGHEFEAVDHGGSRAGCYAAEDGSHDGDDECGLHDGEQGFVSRES